MTITTHSNTAWSTTKTQQIFACNEAERVERSQCSTASPRKPLNEPVTVCDPSVPRSCSTHPWQSSVYTTQLLHTGISNSFCTPRTQTTSTHKGQHLPHKHNKRGQYWSAKHVDNNRLHCVNTHRSHLADCLKRLRVTLLLNVHGGKKAY